MSLRRELLVVGLLVMLALVLRFIDLGGESVWLDEAFSLDMAQYALADLWRGEPLDPGNPPGYYLLLHGWMKIFGTSAESGRAMSGVMGTLVIVASWLLALAAGVESRVRLLATLLVAVSPPMIYLSREVRVYTTFILVVTLGLAAVEWIVRADWSTSKVGRIAGWLAFILLASTFSYLHYYSFLILCVIGLYMFVRLAGRGIGAIATLVGAYIAIGLAFVPWLPTFLDQIKLGTTRGGGTWLMHLVVTPLYSVAGHTLVWKEDGLIVVGALSAIAMLVYLPALYWHLASGRVAWGPLVLSVGLVLVAVAISVLKSPMLQSRYLSVIHPALMILLAGGLVHGFTVWRRGARIASWGLVGLMTASLVLLYTVRHKEDWRPVAGFIAKEGISLPVYCYEDMAKLSLKYYSPWSRVIPIDPVASSFTPAGSRWDESGLAGKLADHPAGCWFVLYLSLSETMPELSAIDAWLRTRFDIQVEYGDAIESPSFPLIHVYKLTRKSNVATAPASSRDGS